MTEQLRNNAVSTLNGTIDDVQMSILVASNLAFPPSGNFTIIVDAELMLVTAVTGNNFTVQRGSESSTAAQHNSGVNVTNIISNRSLTQLIRDIASASSVGITSGPIANLPAAGTNGTLFLPTNSPVLLRDNGTAWVPFGPLMPMKPVPTAGWSPYGFNGSAGCTSLTQDAGGTIFFKEANATTEHHRLYARNLPARPYNITIAFLPIIPYVAGTFPSVGLMLMNVTDAREAITFGSLSGTANQDVYVWPDGNSSSSGHPACQPMMMQFGAVWYRVSENAANRTWSYSMDGINFIQFLQEPANTGLNGADRVGIFVNSVNAPLAAMTLLSYEEKP